MMLHDDFPGGLAMPLAKPPLVRLRCPDCWRHEVLGFSDAHVADLLAIHREGTCQGGGNEPPA